MTKKHYLVVEVSGGLADIYDNITEENIMDVNEAVNKLNELTWENQTLKAENMLLKQQLKEQDDVKWLRENTVWETMPTSRRTFSRTSLTEDKDG